MIFWHIWKKSSTTQRITTVHCLHSHIIQTLPCNQRSVSAQTCKVKNYSSCHAYISPYILHHDSGCKTMLSFMHKEKLWYPMEGGWVDSISTLDALTRRKFLPKYITLIRQGEIFKSVYKNVIFSNPLLHPNYVPKHN